ncbi:hypothetical protein Tco_1308454, partial [Tanacetum coccineum]
MATTGLGVQSTTICTDSSKDETKSLATHRTRSLTSKAGGLVTTRSISVPEVIDDYMSLQHTNSSKDETKSPATHGTRSPTSKPLTKEDGLSAIATKLGSPLMLDSYTTDMCMQSWGRSSYARAMIELRADVELKDNTVAVMPKFFREGYYTCNIHVRYEWKPPRYACCKVLGHVLEECPKNIGAGATKNLKK